MYEKDGENAWLSQERGTGVAMEATARIAALEAALGRAHLELDFLRHALATLQKGGVRLPPSGR